MKNQKTYVIYIKIEIKKNQIIDIMVEKKIDLEKKVGEKITLIGRVSNVMWQHFNVNIQDYPHINYMDLDDTHQIVVYSKEPIICKNIIELSGEVIKIDTKNNDPKSKIHDGFVEYQLIVDSWKCL